ncbi:hypothetical protein BsWGS_27183 [Bradybaena similaris]
MSVTVKVFFETTDGSVEIRRFLINTTEGDYFTTIKEEIRRLFTVLANSRFALYWKDPDGDLVAFSTLEEMSEALTYATDGIFRVHVFEGVETLDSPEPQIQESPGSQQPGSHLPSNSQPSVRPAFNTHNQSQPRGSGQSQPQQPGPGSGHMDENLHQGIWCNACRGPVKGIRYKCCVCPDFNLCQTCEAKGVHAEHDMYKINHPHHFCQFSPCQHHPVFSQQPGQHPVFNLHGFAAPKGHADASASFSSSTGPIPGPVEGFPPSHPHPEFMHHLPGFSVPGAPDANANFSRSTGPIPCPFGGFPQSHPHPVFIHHLPGFSVPRAPDASASFSSRTGPMPSPFGAFPPGHPPAYSVPRAPDASASFSSSTGPIPGPVGGFPPGNPPGYSVHRASDASASFSSSTGPIPGPVGGFPPNHPPAYSVPRASDASASFSSSSGPIPGPVGWFHPAVFSVPRAPFASAKFSSSCGPNPGMFGGANFSGSCGVNPGGTSFGGSCGLNPGMSGGINFNTGTNTDQKDTKPSKPSADGPLNQNELNLSELMDRIYQVQQSLEQMLSMCSSLLAEDDSTLDTALDAIVAATEQLENLKGGR